MNARQAFGRGGFVAAACVACCAPPIIAALGLTAGLAATAGIFLGLAAAIAVVLIGGAWIRARSRRRADVTWCAAAGEPVPVSAPTRRRADVTWCAAAGEPVPVSAPTRRRVP